LPEKLSKYPNFYDICPKNLQNFRILHDFARKIPEFDIIIARKIFSPNFRGARAPSPYPPSPKPMICFSRTLQPSIKRSGEGFGEAIWVFVESGIICQ